MDVKGGEAIYISLTFRYGNVNHLNIVSYKLKKSNIIGGKGDKPPIPLLEKIIAVPRTAFQY